ncbi:hypothetical protein [Faecalimicrobium dakarense]|uniref:hypothetical protein n=1 Tax=Faecalimicrobium dakarense TaxID=1301100 RepID=UPI0004AC66DE|nr:hypothetical protein [[Clostridium] dakarense]
MENKNNINGLQACSNDLMNVATMLNPEGFGGQPHHLTPCDIFDIIKCILVGSPCSHHCWQTAQAQLEEMGFCPHPGHEGILDRLCEELEDVICNVDNHRLKKQLERALDLCKCLKQTLKSINCIDGASHLVGKLFCILLQVILLVVSIIVKIIVLLAFCKHEHTCNDVTSSFCDCLICDLEKELDEIQKLIEKLGDLAIAFIKFAAKKCRPHNDNCHDDKCNDDWKFNDNDWPFGDEDWEFNNDWKKHDDFKCDDDWKKHNDCKCHDDWKKHNNCKCHDDWKKHNCCKCKKDFGCKF